MKDEDKATIEELFQETLEHPHTRIEYLRKKSKKNRAKKGVLISFINPHNLNEVLFGFSMCSSLDQWDKPNGLPNMENFGKSLAFERAMKWANYENFLIAPFPKSKKNERAKFISRVVYVPKTVYAPLKKFIANSRNYYKDKTYPEWTVKTINS